MNVCIPKRAIKLYRVQCQCRSNAILVKNGWCSNSAEHGTKNQLIVGALSAVCASVQHRSVTNGALAGVSIDLLAEDVTKLLGMSDSSLVTIPGSTGSGSSSWNHGLITQGQRLCSKTKHSPISYKPTSYCLNELFYCRYDYLDNPLSNSRSNCVAKNVHTLVIAPVTSAMNVVLILLS